MKSHAEAMDLCNQLFREIERINGGVENLSIMMRKIESFGMGMYPALVSTMKIITYSVSIGQIPPKEGAMIVTDLINFILSTKAKEWLDRRIKEVEELKKSGADLDEINERITRSLMKTIEQLGIPEEVVSSAIGVDITTKESDFIPSTKETFH